MSVPFRVRVGLLVLICSAFIGGYLFFSSAHPQPPEYHNFADDRTFVGTPNMLNVWSNLPFLAVGVWGLIWMARHRSSPAFTHPSERWAYRLYFLGLALTGIGSSYYHANPNNETLVWDRMALAMTFMALFTAIVAERLWWRLSAPLALPMVLLGVGSVLYWHWTETEGAGDLRCYFVVQFFPLVAVPILLVGFRPRYTGSENLLASLACYGVAKLVEYFDANVYAQLGLVSGHTLKHLLAGGSAYFILFMLQRRRSDEVAEPEASAKRAAILVE